MSQNKQGLHLVVLEALHEKFDIRADKICEDFQDFSESENKDSLGPILQALKKQPSHFFLKCTNFSEKELMDIYLDLEAISIPINRRGPKPSISLMDSLIIICSFYKFGGDYDKMAALFGAKVSILQSAVTRIQMLLL
jgi:hypothetical protein